MGFAVDKLVAAVDTKDRHDIPTPELLPLQIEAVNERLRCRVNKIKLLGKRAESIGTIQIDKLADLVPLLFEHTAYKSYPESWLTQGKWALMGRWLDSITSHPVEGINIEGVKDVDDWIERLGSRGHYVSCSSGTTGKCSILPASMVDRDFTKRSMIACFEWTTGLKPSGDYKMIGGGPLPHNTRSMDCSSAVIDAYGDGDPLRFPGEPITVGHVGAMVTLRRRVADGTARPSDIAAFEQTSAKRAKMMEEGVEITVQRVIDNRHRKLVISGMIATLHRVATEIRARGYSGEDFHPENVIQTAGGLKGATLPADYRKFILDTFNVKAEREFQFYSMQEISTALPRCSADRYHAPPWLIVLLLNDEGNNLIEPSGDTQEGRAAFFDVAVDARWGGIITGDKIHVNYGKCGCGHEGPSIASDIVRYSDLPGGDKISCSGSVDAYVRGAS